MTENTNPLGKYYRQPQIYIKLPSGGRYYPKEVYTPTETGEIPILPMTAKDEMAFKTPDAMINGQATQAAHGMLHKIECPPPKVRPAWLYR